jgi:hypothetical protein
MRADMAKVIVERPRFKGGAGKKPKGYRRRLRRYGEDGPPGREGIKACWQGGTKSFNEHLGPLRRYLDKQVGRPWDKVYSEICAHIDRGSVVQKHILTHVADYVATDVILIDGVPCSGQAGYSYGKPLHQFRYRPWYVCPRTGLLRRVKATGRKRPRRPKPEGPPQYVPLSKTLQCRILDGSWHLVALQPLPALPASRERSTAIDILLNLPITRIDPLEARRYYGAEVYAVAVRRLARKELSQYPIPARWWG